MSDTINIQQFDSVTDYVYTVRLEGGMPVETTHSDSCVAVTGYTPQEFRDNPYLWIVMVHEEDVELVRQHAEQILLQNLPKPIRHRIIRKDGAVRWVESSIIPNHYADGSLLSYHGVVRDITELMKAEEQLYTAAITDELTGLLNRRGFFACSERHCKLAERFKRKLSLLYLDLDGMKNINDELGHKEGDQALIDTADLLRKTFRKTDIIARIGGDEFAVLLTEHNRSDIDHIIFDHVKKNLKEHNKTAGRNYELMFSMGFVHNDPFSLSSIDSLMAEADKLMYKDKVNNKFEKRLNDSLKDAFTERRAYKRVPTGDKCWAEFSGKERVRLNDISIGGMCVETLHYMPLHSSQKARIISGDQEAIQTEGIVVWSNSIKKKNNDLVHHDTGLRFSGMNDRLKSSLGQFIINLTN